jgi:hypothetical protein
MQPTYRSAICKTAAVLALCGWSFAWAQLPAAKVMSVTGVVKVIDPQGRERTLEKGADVRSGEKIITADGALVQMRLNDGGYLSVRSGTEMVIDRFVYDDKNAANSNFLVSLVRGGFRSITGLIGKTNPDAYQIRTSTATVGIRGTDHEPMVIPEGIPAMAALGAPGFYDKVNDGETFIRNRTGQLTLKRGDVGFAPVIADRAPLALQKVPDFYKVEVKTDARDPKEATGDANRKADPAAGGMLRPSLAARREAIKTDGALDVNNTTLATPALRATTLNTLSTTGTTPISTDKVLSTTSTTLLAPTNSLIAPTTTVKEPISTSTLIAPTTTLIAPTTTLVAPTTTYIAPSTTLIAPTTTFVAPTTTLVAPSTTYIAPTTTLIAPTTTLIAPTTTISPTTTFKSTTLIK